MNLIYKITQPIWTLYKWLAKGMGYDSPLKTNLWPWAIIALLWFIIGGATVELLGWDAFDYDNDAVQLKLTVFGLSWFLFGCYLAVGIYIHKLRIYEQMSGSNKSILKTRRVGV